MSDARSACFLTFAMAQFCNVATAAECRLDHAIYEEPSSGSVIAFYPKAAELGLMTSAVFELHLPNRAAPLPGSVAWGQGKYARPDAAIAGPCLEPPTDKEQSCQLWSGSVYAVGNNDLWLIESDNMIAPPAILFADFGRSLLWSPVFTDANPQSFAFDLFHLTSCTP